MNVGIHIFGKKQGNEKKKTEKRKGTRKVKTRKRRNEENKKKEKEQKNEKALPLTIASCFMWRISTQIMT